MARVRRRKKQQFENSKDMGSFIDIEFEVVDEHDKKPHSFSAGIHYVEMGEGPPLVLVHGIGQSLYTWRDSIDFFAENGFRVFAVDLPGYGYSTHPNIYYTVEENAVVIKAFMEALDIESACFAGFSTGALSILHLYEMYPDVIDKLVLVSPGGPNEMYPFMLRFLTTRLGHFLFRLRFTEYTLERILKELFFDKPMVSEQMTAQYYEPFKKKSVRDTLVMSLRHFNDNLRSSSLHAVKKDAVVFSGESDPIHLPQMLEKFIGIPGTEHIRLRNCGHFVNEEKPDRFNSETLSFLNSDESDKIFI